MTDTTETPTLSKKQLAQFKAAFGESDKALCARAVFVADAYADGFTGKTLADQLRDERRVDLTIPAITAKYLGIASQASKVAELIGIDLVRWTKSAPSEVARILRTAGRDGVGGPKVTKAAQDALKVVTTEDIAERREIVQSAIDGLASHIIPAGAKVSRAARNAGGTGGDDENEGGEKVETVPVAGRGLTDVEALKALRAITRHISHAGVWSRDWDAAAADLVSELSALRKRAGTKPRTAGKPVTPAVA